MNVKKIAIIIVAIIAVGFIASCSYVGDIYERTSPPTPSPTPAGKVVIRYSDDTTHTLTSVEPGFTDSADLGYVFLILNLEIENQGYESVSTGHAFFYVIINNVKYSHAQQGVFGSEDRLKVVNLLDGGRITGKLTFEVPQEVTSVGYQPIYDFVDNVEWIRH